MQRGRHFYYNHSLQTACITSPPKPILTFQQLQVVWTDNSLYATCCHTILICAWFHFYVCIHRQRNQGGSVGHPLGVNPMLLCSSKMGQKQANKQNNVCYEIISYENWNKFRAHIYLVPPPPTPPQLIIFIFSISSRNFILGKSLGRVHVDFNYCFLDNYWPRHWKELKNHRDFLHDFFPFFDSFTSSIFFFWGGEGGGGVVVETFGEEVEEYICGGNFIFVTYLYSIQ